MLKISSVKLLGLLNILATLLINCGKTVRPNIKTKPRASIFNIRPSTGVSCNQLVGLTHVEGCKEAPLSYQDPTSNTTVQLYFQFYQHSDQKQPTIIFLNGGPGQDLSAYLSIQEIKNLYIQGYSLFFFDQRGTGFSSPLGDEEETAEYRSHFHSEDHLKDLEFLREKVINQEKIVVFGHSYGAHLAQAYGAMYPKHVEKIVAVNGGLDFLGFFIQPLARKQILQDSLKTINPMELARLELTLQAKKLRDESGTVLIADNFYDRVYGLISTYMGQATGAADWYKKLIHLNGLQNHPNDRSDAPAINSFSLKTEIDSVSRGSEANSSLNLEANLNIVCHEFLPLDQSFFSSLNLTYGYYFEALNYFNSRCTEIFQPTGAKIFDFKQKAKNISVPVLLVGATHDPLIPLSIQQRDYDLYKAFNQHASILKMENVGHQVFAENPSCFFSKLADFLSDKIDAATLTCPPP